MADVVVNIAMKDLVCIEGDIRSRYSLEKRLDHRAVFGQLCSLARRLDDAKTLADRQQALPTLWRPRLGSNEASPKKSSDPEEPEVLSVERKFDLDSSRSANDGNQATISQGQACARSSTGEVAQEPEPLAKGTATRSSHHPMTSPSASHRAIASQGRQSKTHRNTALIGSPVSTCRSPRAVCKVDPSPSAACRSQCRSQCLARRSFGSMRPSRDQSVPPDSQGLRERARAASKSL